MNKREKETEDWVWENMPVDDADDCRNTAKLIASRENQAITSILKEVEREIQADLDNGMFYKICSNEGSFKEYIQSKLTERGENEEGYFV